MGPIWRSAHPSWILPLGVVQERRASERPEGERVATAGGLTVGASVTRATVSSGTDLREGPLVGGPQNQRSGEPVDGSAVGKDPDRLGTGPDLAVHLFTLVRASALGPALAWDVPVVEDNMRPGAELFDLLAPCVGDGVPLSLGLALLGDDRLRRRRQGCAPLGRGLCRRVSYPANATSLAGGIDHPPRSRPLRARRVQTSRPCTGSGACRATSTIFPATGAGFSRPERASVTSPQPLGAWRRRRAMCRPRAPSTSRSDRGRGGRERGSSQ